MGRMIGIDLGTTSSCVAVMERGVARVIPNQEGERTTPTLVCFTAEREVLVGRAARLQPLAKVKSTVAGVTRLLGRKFDPRGASSGRAPRPLEIVPAPNGDLRVEVEGRAYAPEEIASFVLLKLKAAAEEYLGEAVEQAVLTVPAHFNDLQRQATRQAGRIAGLDVARVVNASTAAALAFGKDRAGEGSRRLAVCDLGGGTLDVTLLELAEGLVQVRATGGDASLGGEDFDQRIVDWLVGEFRRETAIDLTPDRIALQKLKQAAEGAKRELTTARWTEIVLPFVSAGVSGPKHLNTVLTRQKYEELTAPLLEKAIEPCRQCLAAAQMTPEQIDEVLLVGGQTRAPMVSEVMRKLFDREPSRALDPDVSAALGAAIQAGIIQGEVEDLVLLDVTPHTLGIETKDGTFTPLIERNRPIPTRKSRVFTTMTDDQTRVEVHVLQGESDMAAYNKSLQKFELTSIPRAPRGVPQIEVGFEIDVNGIVSVEATDQATGRRQAITIHPSGGLSPAEVDRLAQEAATRWRGVDSTERVAAAGS